MAIFGVSQILLSQIPDFHELSWLSFVAAVMSFGYASIGIGLSIAKIAVYFPTEIYLIQSKVPKFSTIWIGMKLLNGFSLIVTLVAIIGSMEGIIYKPFQSN
ncbi:uncharacterized protein [Cicer arietinum]|uniref:Amino acid permease 6-like n=1 Tax=Cicer arietinum TaxID=3827 RepID=A0A1S2Z5H3_CICAR|nr:amino acid permease 6-like [Cicer arietinum]